MTTPRDRANQNDGFLRQLGLILGAALGGSQLTPEQSLEAAQTFRGEAAPGPERNIDLGDGRILNVAADDPRSDEEIREQFLGRRRRESRTRRGLAPTATRTATESVAEPVAGQETDAERIIRESLEGGGQFGEISQERIPLAGGGERVLIFSGGQLVDVFNDVPEQPEEAPTLTPAEQASIRLREEELGFQQTQAREAARRERLQRQSRDRELFTELLTSLTPRDRIGQASAFGRGIASLGTSDVGSILQAFGVPTSGPVSQVATDVLAAFGFDTGAQQAAARGLVDQPDISSSLGRFLTATDQRPTQFVEQALAGQVPGETLPSELAALVPGGEAGGAIPLDFDPAFIPDIRGALLRGTISQSQAEDIMALLGTQGSADFLLEPSPRPRRIGAARDVTQRR